MLSLSVYISAEMVSASTLAHFPEYSVNFWITFFSLIEHSEPDTPLPSMSYVSVKVLQIFVESVNSYPKHFEIFELHKLKHSLESATIPSYITLSMLERSIL